MRFDDPCVYFRSTKSHEDRFVPLSPQSGLLPSLQRLKVQTQQDGGPFASYRGLSSANKRWRAAVEYAGIAPITVHDLRRTGITRALLAGMPPAAVQKLAGHSSIVTTMKYYVEVSKQDLREAVAKLRTSAAG